MNAHAERIYEATRHLNPLAASRYKDKAHLRDQIEKSVEGKKDVS